MQRPLFGGAITAMIPTDWRDVSDIRQVPDHQECWQDSEGRLLVVEILERQKVDDPHAAKYFFDDLADAESNAASEKIFAAIPSPLASVEGMPATTKLCLGVGYQRLKLGRDVDIAGNPRQQESRAIRVEVGVVRLLEKETDILITLSTPSEPNPQETTVNTATMSTVFQQAVTSFRINDWGLFG